MKPSLATLLSLFVLSLLVACGGEVATEAETAAPPASTTPPSSSRPARAAAQTAGPGFCGKIRVPEIEAAFIFKLEVADVSVAEELECHYNLAFPGSEHALLIYRMQPIVMYDAFKDSRRNTGDISGLGEEAFLVGNAQIDVKLDDERAFEVALQIINTTGEPLAMTVEEIKEGLTRFARMLSVRL